MALKISKIIFFFLALLCIISAAACSARQNTDVKATVSVFAPVISSETSREEPDTSHQLTVINKTGSSFVSLAISPTRQAKWGENLLAKEANLGEDSLLLKISAKASETKNRWDLCAVDDKNREIVWENLDIFSLGEIVLFIEDMLPIAIWQ